MPPVQQIGTTRDQLKRVLTIVRRTLRYWWVVGIFCVVGGGVTVFLAKKMKRQYMSETVLLYREGFQENLISNREQGQDNAARLGQRLKDMLLARPRLQAIIEELKLYPDIVARNGYVEAVDVMRTKIEFRMPGGDTFHIAYRGETPESCQKVTERLAQALVEDNARLRVEQADVNKAFLDEQKKAAEDELKKKEKDRAEFLAKHPEYAIDTAGTGSGSGAGVRQEARRGNEPRPAAISRYCPRYDKYNAERNNLKSKLGMPIPKKDADPKLVAEVDAAEDARKEALAELAAKLRQYTEQHPEVRAAKQGVVDAEARLKRAKDALARGNAATGPAPGDTINREELQRQLYEVEAAINKCKQWGGGAAPQDVAPPTTDVEKRIVALETDYSRLTREVADARERNQSLETAVFRASISSSAEASGRANQLLVVDPAFKPTRPTGKGRGVIAMAGLAVSLMLGLGLALLLALVDDRLYDRFDVEKLELAPLLIVVPRGGAKRRRPRG